MEALQEDKIIKFQCPNLEHDRYAVWPVEYSVAHLAYGSLWERKDGLRAHDYPLENINEIEEILDIPYQEKSFRPVFDLLEWEKEKDDIIPEVDAPFGALCTLIDPITVIRSLRKERNLIERVIAQIRSTMEAYIREIIKRGVTVISMGDSTGSVELLGRKYYEIPGESMYSLLKALEPDLKSSCIHLCGKTSTSLEQCGYLRSEKVKGLGCYGQLLKTWGKLENITIIGHSCISILDQEADGLWLMKLT